MAQFKVGDRVRFNAEAKADLQSEEYQAAMGKVFIVTRIEPFLSSYHIHAAGIPCGKTHASWIEPAPALIDPAKTYQTRDGRAVRIYAVDGAKDEYQIHGAIKGNDGWVVDSWTAEGAYYGLSDERDLIEVKPEREGWLNVYEVAGQLMPSCVVNTSREDADANQISNRIACLHLKFRQGDGL